MICKYKANKKFELALGKSFVTSEMCLMIYYFKSNNSSHGCVVWTVFYIVLSAMQTPVRQKHAKS